MVFIYSWTWWRRELHPVVFAYARLRFLRGLTEKKVCYSYFFFNWVYIPIIEVIRYHKAVSYLTSTLIKQYLDHLKILCQHNLLVMVGNVLLFRFFLSLTPINNTVFPLFLDCGKQQLIISFHCHYIICNFW